MSSTTGLKIALVTAGLAAGAIGATALGANAATTSGSGSNATTSTGTSTQTRAPAGRPNPGGSAPVRSDEKSVTSAQEATLRAAALKAIPGGTVIRVETDAGDATYEVHMKKADGSRVTVKFDKSLAVTKVEDGMGAGDPAPAGTGNGGRSGNGAMPGGH
jgi:hypothetical protein